MSSGHLPAPRCWNCRPDLSGSRLLTISEAARSCCVSINAVYQWMEQGLIDWVLTPGGMRRIFAETRQLGVRLANESSVLEKAGWTREPEKTIRGQRYHRFTKRLE